MEFTAAHLASLVALITATDELSTLQVKEKDFLSELAETNGKTDEVNAAVEAAQKPEEKDDKPDQKPGILDNARALVSDKAKLQTANSALAKENGTLKAETSRLTAELATITAERDSLITERDSIQAALDTAKADAQDVNEKTRDELAGLGQPESELPAKGGKTAPQSLDEIREAMKNTDDPKEKGKLAAQAIALRNKMN